jgi:hypothetical protein
MGSSPPQATIVDTRPASSSRTARLHDRSSLGQGECLVGVESRGGDRQDAERGAQHPFSRRGCKGAPRYPPTSPPMPPMSPMLQCGAMCSSGRAIASAVNVRAPLMEGPMC